ncbi:hypothetical protein EUGRSUZ_G02103 [Eucalyptus grandis]|uniref:Uncharacterized protein n=2 Tax=Eucalyptus grandis TaxID=71139 RepID=A0ACC3K632_EUCGR|nr:hypothetical protein EUGRSUZ_G02103 [Eucalyptus grandis]
MLETESTSNASYKEIGWNENTRKGKKDRTLGGAWGRWCVCPCLHSVVTLESVALFCREKDHDVATFLEASL